MESLPMRRMLQLRECPALRGSRAAAGGLDFFPTKSQPLTPPSLSAH